MSGQTPERRWTTVEDLPRYTHNYWGLRNRFGILSETYSYLPFADRVTVCATVPRRGARLRARQRRDGAAPDGGSRTPERWSVNGCRCGRRPKRSAEMVEILMGAIEEEVNPYCGGVMQRRTDVRRPERMWEYATFESTEQERVPSAYYVPAPLTAVIDRLRAHGIRLERVAEEQHLSLEQFTIESTEIAEREFEHHRERTTTGRYTVVNATVAAGTWRVDMTQPLARLAFYLIEPRSNDGLLTWNFLDEGLKISAAYPILRTRD